MQVLPANTIDGVIYYKVYAENIDVYIVEAFLEGLLPYCGRCPGPRYIIFIDNTLFYVFSAETKILLAKVGILIEYQVPYSPDLSPIEYLFGSVKNRSRKRSREDQDLVQGNFKSYL